MIDQNENMQISIIIFTF